MQYALQLQNKQQMESSLPHLNHVEQDFAIGFLRDTPNIYFIPIVDLDHRRIKVPCSSLDITISQFLEEYKINTSCKKLLKNVPTLVIMQGKKQGQLALPQQTLMSFEFNLNKVCFHVKDTKASEFEGLIISSHLLQSKKKVQDIQIKILFENKIYLLTIKTTYTLLHLKKTAIAEINPLKSKSPDLLQVQHKGFFIINDKDLLSKYQITGGSVVLILIKKKSGCFSKKTKIMMADGTEETIDSIKKGDKVLSFNQKEKKIEVDMVTYVQKNIIKQALEIEIQGNIKIQSTPNHKFLCEDGKFKCFTKDRDNQVLQQNSSLSLWNGGTVKIISIFNKKNQPQSEEYYHLSIEKNHNFIANGLIVHNMIIKVKFQTNNIAQFNVTPQNQILIIKKQIEELYNINVHYQKLYYFGKELQNNKTIADYNIPKESTLHFHFPKVDTNLVKRRTPILTANGTVVEVQYLTKGSKIATFDIDRNRLSQNGTIVLNIEEIESKDLVRINLKSFDKQNELLVNGDSFIQCQNGQVVCVRDLCFNFDEENRPRVKTVHSEAVQIRGIYYMSEQEKETFYRISSNAYNFITKDIIMHDFVVNVIFFKQKKRIQKITLSSYPEESLLSIKKRLKKMKESDANILFNIDIDKARYIFDENVIQDKDKLQKYELDSSKIIAAHIDESVGSILKSSDIIFVTPNEVSHYHDKDVILKVSTTEEFKITYLQNRYKSMEDILKQLLPTHFNYTSCFFIFAKTLIFPSDDLIKIQESPQFSKSNQIELLMANNQKMAFLHALNMKKQDFKNHSMLLTTESLVLPDQVISRLSKEYIIQNIEFMSLKQVYQSTQRIAKDLSIVHENCKLQTFYNPFLFLTSRINTENINDYIHNFYKYKHQLSNPRSLFTVIKDLYLNMQILPFYYDKCYFGIKNIRFSRYFKENNTFYFRSFTIAFKKGQKVKQEILGHSGTVFIIKSLNGKEIEKYSLYPQEKEILFAPYTYLLIERIIHKEEYDQVYLVQLSSPISFLKDIILWVDDEPKNNIRDIVKIYKQTDVQILQVTSTTEALKWIQEFGWLMTWKGLEFKLISDMSRWEMKEPQMFLNKRAGIDLLIELYNNFGVTAHTLIYCGDEKKARTMAKQANIPKDRYDITINSNTLRDYCRKWTK